MVINLLICVLVLWSAAKTVGYCIYTFKCRNIAGGISLIVLVALNIAAVAVFMR